MKLSLASLASAPRSFAEVRRPKAAAVEPTKYAAKLVDLDDDDSPTWMIDTRRPRVFAARV